MDTRQRFGVAGAVVAASAAVGVAAAPELPVELATHWNADGEPDDTVPKALALGLLPGERISRPHRKGAPCQSGVGSI